MIDARAALARAPYVRAGVRGYASRDVGGISGVTVHYTAGSPQATVWDVARYQVGLTAQEAFPALAYHLFVSQEGEVYICHSLTTRVWHSGAVVDGVPRNRSHVGICYAGNVEPNPAQLVGLREAIVWCEAKLGRSLSIEGHGDVYATVCPGPRWAEWRRKVVGGLGMDDAELRELLVVLRRAWAMQAQARAVVVVMQADGSAAAAYIVRAAGDWLRALNSVERALGEPLTD